MRPPVVAGLAPGDGASTLAAALHGVDAGVWTGGPVDVLVARSGAGPLPAGVPVRVLVAKRPLPAADPARAVVVLPVVPQWSDPAGARSAARLLGLTEERTPCDLRPAAAALRAVVAALLRSGVLERPCAAPALLPASFRAPSSGSTPSPGSARSLGRRPSLPPVDLPGDPAADPPAGPPPALSPAPPPAPLHHPPDPVAEPSAVDRAPSLRAVPVPVRASCVVPVLLHRSAPVVPTLVAGRPLRWTGAEAPGPPSGREDLAEPAPGDRVSVGWGAGRRLSGEAGLDHPVSITPSSVTVPSTGHSSGPPPARRRALRAGLLVTGIDGGPRPALRTG